MFGSKNRGTVIAKGLKIVGTVTAEGLVEVNGRIDGELHCTSLVISRGAHVAGTIAAGRVVVDGNVEGPIQGGDVILKSKAHVVGDIHHQSLSIESGAFFDGRSVHPSRANAQATERAESERIEKRSVRQIAAGARETASQPRRTPPRRVRSWLRFSAQLSHRYSARFFPPRRSSLLRRALGVPGCDRVGQHLVEAVVCRNRRDAFTKLRGERFAGRLLGKGDEHFGREQRRLERHDIVLQPGFGSFGKARIIAGDQIVGVSRHQHLEGIVDAVGAGDRELVLDEGIEVVAVALALIGDALLADQIVLAGERNFLSFFTKTTTGSKMKAGWT